MQETTMNKIKLLWNKFCIFVTGLVENKDMASIIKITPTLKGEDAINFYKRIKANNKVSVKRTTSIKTDAQKLRAILK